jgi:hypothetical protein
MEYFDKAIESAKLEYISDIEWAFKYEDSNFCIYFYKDENGKNHIEEFLINKKGVWIDITPTDEQVKIMWSKLDAVPYREVESESSESITDLYDYYGVKREDFY